MSTVRPAAVIVLAAGDGTRMKSDLNKMLHTIGGHPLVGHAMRAADATGAEHLVGVVRAQRDAVAEAIAVAAERAAIADQDDVKGTGRAAECGLELLPGDLQGTVLVTYGDTPLLTAATLLQLTAEHEAAGNAVTVLTAEVIDATGYGRVLRAPDGSLAEIIEHKDALAARESGDEVRGRALEINEINSGIYAFDVSVLRASLAQVTSENAQGEKYLTDVPAIARAAGGKVAAHLVDDPWEIEGVNDKVQLARLGRELNRRTLERLMRENGAIVVDPATTWVDTDVSIGRDTVVHPDTQLLGATTIGAGCEIGPSTTLKDTEVQDGASVVRTHGELALVGPGASVGPWAYLRPGTELGGKGKIGTFVETKNARIGEGSKVPHLSYIGDATIGRGSNIGAASVTVNYDGVNKHQTTIGDNVRMGSDNMYVAPVTVGDGAGSGAGAVIRKDVPPGALAISVAPQRNIERWALDKRPGTAQAEAAEAALAQQDPSETDEGGRA